VAEGLAKMYTPPVSVPDRPVPADPNEDFDLLVGELVYRFSIVCSNFNPPVTGQ